MDLLTRRLVAPANPGTLDVISASTVAFFVGLGAVFNVLVDGFGITASFAFAIAAANAAMAIAMATGMHRAGIPFTLRTMLSPPSPAARREQLQRLTDSAPGAMRTYRAANAAFLTLLATGTTIVIISLLV